MSEQINNPWREFIENVINGSNYFRSSEYRRLINDLDRLYAAEATLTSQRDKLVKALEGLRSDLLGLGWEEGDTLIDRIDTAIRLKGAV
jgi:hypothetical protein